MGRKIPTLQKWLFAAGWTHAIGTDGTHPVRWRRLATTSLISS
jgi:hypothetical protein